MFALQAGSAHADGDGMLAQTTTTNAFAGLALFFLALELTFLVLFVIAWVKILNKAGYSGAWVLIGLIPFVNMIMFFVFAFSRWPALDRPSGFYNAPVFNPGGYQPPGSQPLGGYGAATWQSPVAPPPAPFSPRAAPLNSTLPEPPEWQFGAPRRSTPNDVPPPPAPPA
jgi:hypothetical protein